jgi:hypothetical protein
MLDGVNRTERALLLAWFAVVLLVLLTQVSTVFAVLGAAGGVFLALPVARSSALRGRPGRDLVRRSGVRLERIGRTVAAHLVVIAAVVLVAAVVPGLRDRFVALVVAAGTAGAATVTGARLQRG